ncbi:coatomer subunit zeta-1 [Stylonychia lemnae]|uniref:Coatomer subunit zeta n=1 Tax=Stylonychia lemnae TaxID=5949 RepID=A0A077ZYM5_STYLE|nr:coatomer subunit zeta-1 [Stylonychia lemnae]|eukprot:CDW75046.1 coatomer subunit zeta-1 [Stylonychia lemnae]
MLSGVVGDVKGVVVLDNEGKRIISKYYNSPKCLENNTSQKVFERQLFLKSNKQGGSSKINQYENDIMTIDNYTAIFRCYVDMTIYILGDRDDNEMVLAMVLDTVHDCFDTVFKRNIERKSLINNMTAVILVIDELIDQGIVMAADSQIILKRINIKGTGHPSGAGNEGSESSSTTQSSSSSSGGGMFASVFASAKSSLAKSLAF